MAGGGVPFAGPSEARIDIRVAPCDHAELERGAKEEPRRVTEPVEEAFCLGRQVRPADDGRHRSLRLGLARQYLKIEHLARGGVTARKKLTAGRPISPERYVAIRLVWRVDKTENRLLRVDERDVYRELAVFLNKLFGAIERIDKEEASLDIGGVAGSQTLFSDDRDFREKLRKRVEDEIFRRMIGICYRRLIRLQTCIRVRTVNVQDGGAGTLSDWNDRLGQVFERGRFGGHDLIRSFVVNVMSISRERPDDVTFMLAYLFFLRAAVEVQGQIMVPGR